jgi:hypothetical protein
MRGDTLQLAPEAAANAFTIFREPIGRLKADAVFGSHAPKLPGSGGSPHPLLITRWGCSRSLQDVSPV